MSLLVAFVMACVLLQKSPGMHAQGVATLHLHPVPLTRVCRPTAQADPPCSANCAMEISDLPVVCVFKICSNHRVHDLYVPAGWL